MEARRGSGSGKEKRRASLYTRKTPIQGGRRLLELLLLPLPSSLFPLPPSAPETRERRAIRRFTELLERALADLSDALPGHAHQRADLLEGHRVRALLQTVIEVQDLALARRQVLSEHPVDELAHQVEIRDVLDFRAIHSSESLAERACLAIGSI